MLPIIGEWLGTGSINIFGIPFSGKDTQGELLSEYLSASVIGSGDILRSSVLSTEAKETMDAGNLPPSEEFFRVVLPYFNKPEYSQTALVLSSVGRWKGEETKVIQAAQESGHPIKAAFLLTLPEEVAFERKAKVERNRNDDASTQILEKRMEEFRTKTLPALQTYRQLGLLIEVDGSQSPEEVKQEIITLLYQHATGE